MEILTGIAVFTVALLAGLVAAAIIIAWRGLVLAVLWGWFLVPLGLPVVAIPQALGVAVIFSFLMGDVTRNKGADHLLTGILSPLFALGLGYLITLFM